MDVELVRDEVDKRKAELKEKRRLHGFQRFDPTVLTDTDPAFHYRGVNRDDRRIASFRARGYEVVPKDDKANWSSGRTVQSGKEFGDQVLMRIPREDFITHLAEGELKLEAQTAATMADAIENIDRIARNAKVIGPHQSIVVNESSTQHDLVGRVVKPATVVQ